MINHFIRFCLTNKLIVLIGVIVVISWGAIVAPFDWEIKGLPRNPIPVDAIPDIGENQQIVFTKWMGRSPEDVEDQITYPLTVSLLGIPSVKTIRSYSFFGFSTIYVIFKEGVDFYWSRSRILEKLSSLPEGILSDGIKPTLGPDATALGQVFWYTLEGYDEDGHVTGGWDLQELRSVQDWYVRYALQGVEGVSEVASIGGFVKEYQIDVDPDAMRVHNISLAEVFNAVKMSNLDVGARTIEVNRVEYVIRGLGVIKSPKDLENSVVKVNDNVPVYIKDVAHVSLGASLRRGVLDKGGAEAVGGVVIVRYGENPLAAIKSIKQKIKEISPGLPSKTLADGTVSHLRIVPFYDRSDLIYETLGTLKSALTDEILVTMIVVLVSVMHFSSSLLISGLLPLAILMCFMAMKFFGVDANIVSLSGIAIAIGTMVDMGIIVCENILKHQKEAKKDEPFLEVVYRATTEVGSAILTAVSTTVVSFLPVFAMTGPEGKLFKPLAYTKTFALIGSVIVAFSVIPPLAHLLFQKKETSSKIKNWFVRVLLFVGMIVGFKVSWLIGLAMVVAFLYFFRKGKSSSLLNYGVVIVLGVLLTKHWLPLGSDKSMIQNILFVTLLIGGLLYFFRWFQGVYPNLLRWCLEHKLKFLSGPLFLIFLGGSVWLGLDKEFMPRLDEGSYLFMPTMMPHASIGEARDVLQTQDMAIRAIPEVNRVVGKLGRVDSALDPAPISMIETLIDYKSEYLLDSFGRRLRFKYDKKVKDFVRDDQGQLILDHKGRQYRQWRDHIKNPDDIWSEIVKATEIPGTTSAPQLQPIAARIVMLQTGMRAPMGIRVKGPTLEAIEEMGLRLESFLKEVPEVEAAAVFADRVIGKPYLEIDIDREKIARYGISIRSVQDVIEVAIGGKVLSVAVEGRERYPIRVRYMRELRDSIESLETILIPAPNGQQIPISQLADIRYKRGPQAIKSEDTFLTSYVLFDKKVGYGAVDVVEKSQEYLQSKIESGELIVPEGVSFVFAGNYENQVRSAKKLAVILPLALMIIFLILYFQFKSVVTTLLVFSGILVAWSGGFLMIWMYGQDWFLNINFFGNNLRDLFQIHTINLSVAIWVGFLALFGIASDDGVVIATYLNQSFAKRKIDSIEDARKATIEAASRRIRPCLMTSATTILALIPILTSTGRGSDIMIPMAIPSFGGMMVVLISVFLVPVLYCAVMEFKLKRGIKN